MAYHIRASDPSLTHALRRIAGDQLDRAIASAEADGPLHPRIHDIRKRMKKLRGLLRLVRDGFDAYQGENRYLRDIARTLAPLRDAAVLVETYDTVTEAEAEAIDRRTTLPLRRALEAARETAAESEDAATRLTAAASSLHAARRGAAEWQVEEKGFDVLAQGIARTYGRARKAMARAAETRDAADMHEWRKRVKYHWYHTRLLSDIWPLKMDAHEEAADDLGSLLGDRHDLEGFTTAITRSDLAEQPRRALLQAVERRREALDEAAFALGARLLADTPDALTDRWAVWWERWRA